MTPREIAGVALLATTTALFQLKNWVQKSESRYFENIKQGLVRDKEYKGCFTQECGKYFTAP